MFSYQLSRVMQLSCAAMSHRRLHRLRSTSLGFKLGLGKDGGGLGKDGWGSGLGLGCLSRSLLVLRRQLQGAQRRRRPVEDVAKVARHRGGWMDGARGGQKGAGPGRAGRV